MPKTTIKRILSLCNYDFIFPECFLKLLCWDLVGSESQSVELRGTLVTLFNLIPIRQRSSDRVVEKSSLSVAPWKSLKQEIT